MVTDEPWLENCYLVRHVSSGELVLIDPGWNAAEIAQVVLAHGGKISAIWITHAHHDHLGAVGALQERFGVSSCMHRKDERLLRQAATYALVFAQRQMLSLDGVLLFGEDAVLTLGGEKVEVLASPGHTPGGVCYCFKGFVFTGDSLLFRHIGRTDTPGGDRAALVVSVERLFGLCVEDTVLFPGHGRAWTLKEARGWWRSAGGEPPEYKSFGGI